MMCFADILSFLLINAAVCARGFVTNKSTHSLAPTPTRTGLNHYPRIFDAGGFPMMLLYYYMSDTGLRIGLHVIKVNG